MTVADCTQLEQRYEEYALGVLDAAERADLEEHLGRNCPACTLGVERARGLVANLAYAAPDAEPPAALRGKVLEAIREQPRSGSRAVPQLESRRPWIPAWAWAAAAVLAAVTIYTTVQTRRLETESDALALRVAQEQQRSRAVDDERQRYLDALNIIAAPGTKQIQLKPAQPAAPTVTAYWNPQAGLVVAGDKVPELASGRTLQLWIVPQQGMPISVGIFRPNAAGQVLAVLPPAQALGAAKALAISEEPAGGSPQPTSTPGWVGPVA
jgi:anti-sigma-K factor RskA